MAVSPVWVKNHQKEIYERDLKFWEEKIDQQLLTQKYLEPVWFSLSNVPREIRGELAARYTSAGWHVEEILEDPINPVWKFTVREER